MSAENVVAELQEKHSNLMKWGQGSIHAAWEFGDCLNKYLPSFMTKKALAEVIGVSVATVSRYMNLRDAYQRPELAQRAADILQTFDVTLITALVNNLDDGPVGRHPLAGRRYRHRCTSCGSTDIQREEITDPAELAELDSPNDKLVEAN
jgi:transcriptional regulator with XRE-family HTH domain